ncbi:Endonuclease/exonuclease/phosphatase [Metarhizium guizhouense ARSEF 977]|uniref:Endonuclease/exonuclease/phosphatase n=1 Tax=Metarhizium guizhouense (strain ARSEF 977) TaxID=1276136 RepID=A0A0B4GQT8_METGA|nr:Endonuclease/exonuclease/phosphatase [Metarhizium guizhouense ARSEF 977]
MLNTADVPTNSHGNTIDLAFSNITLASAVVEDHLATSSDHFTLSLLPPDVSRSLPQALGKVRVTTDLGASAVEAGQKWHTYAVNNRPRRLTDLYGNELDYDTAVRDEINHQTGLTPVSIRTPRRDNERLPYKTLIISFLEPTKRPWSLFGTSRPARLIESNNPPKQCDNCWGFHTQHACNRQTRCTHCGKTGHTSESCGAAEQCANCLGPHTAELANCPARPRKCAVFTIAFQGNNVNGITIVNVYRRPSYDAALDILLRWSPPERCLVAGDFNAKHYSWQTGRLAGRGDDIAAWAAESGLGLLNTADVPTNPHGNTIDLAFSNIDLASAVVEDHLATSSDHFTLSLTIPNVTLAPTGTPGKVRVTSEEELQRFKELVEAGQAGALPKRWAVDLVAALVHDIEEAFAHKQVVTLVTADIQGAFDSALYNRLVLRLREQGWPDNVARSAAFHRALRYLRSYFCFTRSRSTGWANPRDGSVMRMTLPSSALARACKKRQEKQRNVWRG